jgi:hypothetical protein
MIKVIHDMPPGTVGLEAVGKVTAEDYEQVLKPALEDALTHKDVRLMYVLGEEFDTYAPEAAWADTRLWASNMNAWERIAVVSDADWLEHSLKTLGWLVPGEIKVFETDEVLDAKRWLVGLEGE